MRDDFSDRTKLILAQRVGFRCSNPDCRKPTSGPRTEPTETINIGVGAHITAASEGGPRYNPSLTSEERRQPQNGIWLCQNCAKLIDNDPDRYSVTLLQDWKGQAERDALQELEQRVPLRDRLARAFTGDTEAQRALRHRRTMLQLVRNTWIEGLLEKSLYGVAMIELGMEDRTDAVERPWEMAVQMPDQPCRQLPRGTKIVDIFEESNQALLVLGRPGSGKTTMLLELARDTIARAEKDPAEPIPVVFNLSSWAEKQLPIAQWLVLELNSKYYIPEKIARPWVENDELLLLLDGLDEVKAELREGCVQELNAFRLKHLVPVVVCSRSEEYESLTINLKLSGAVQLQPLTSEQIHEYIEGAGIQLAAVSRILEYDSALQKLAQTPLMLSIMSIAYKGESIGGLESLGPEKVHRQHLFAAYVQCMFERRGADQPYTSEQTVSSLSWLAQKLLEQAQSVFLLEELQPAWLPTHERKRARAVAGLLGGLLFGLVAGVPFGLLWGLAVGLSWGLVAGLLSALFFGGSVALRGLLDSSIEPVEELAWSWRQLVSGLMLGLVVGLLGGLQVALFGGVGMGLVFALVHGSDVGQQDVPAFMLASGLILWLFCGLFLALLTGMLGGLGPARIGTRTIPNQGILKSAKNSMLVAPVAGMVFALLGGLFGALFGRMLWGALSGLFLGVFLGLWGAGSVPVIQHLALRYVLWRSNCLPWKLVGFLDYTTERILLRKVGGGYVFIHRLLQDYFASLDSEGAVHE